MKILSLNSSCQFFGAKLKTFDNQTSNHIKEAQENNKKYSRSSVISMQDSINANLEYKKQLNEAKKTVLTPKIEQFLANRRFKFCDKDGNITALCLEDKIKQSIKMISSIDTELYHATFTKEAAQNIIENGFDEKLISRTKYGPGFYFTYSEGDARNYGSCVLSAHCKGSLAVMKPDYYEEIMIRSDIPQRLLKCLNLNSKEYPACMIEQESVSKIINQFCNKLLSQKLGIDFSYGSNGRSSAVVVHNLDKVSDIKIFS